MKKDEMLNELRNMSDSDLVEMVSELNMTIIPKDSLLRTTSVKFYGEDDGNTIMYMVTQLSHLILIVMSERFSYYSPHIN